MNSKSLLIAIAALALTASGAQAFSGETLRRAGLSESQRAAFAVARDLREEGDTEGARDVLIQAGIDEVVIERVRSAMAGDNAIKRTAIHDALDADDYEAFVRAIEGSPLSDIITTRDDFDQFKAAHVLKTAGDREGANEIFAELGVPLHGEHAHTGKKQVRGEELTPEQQAAFAVARSANDREAMDAIIEEAGIGRASRVHSPKFLRDGRILD